MKAFLLAAGRGERLRPLTETRPKPLVEVGGKPLIFWHIDKLRDAGITDLVINCHWLAEQLQQSLGDGAELGVQIQWSPEPQLLDVGGGLRAALPLLGSEPFVMISADIWSDFDYNWLASAGLEEVVAKLIMVPNPDFYPAGDFALQFGKLGLLSPGEKGFTYSGIGLLHPDWVAGWASEESAFSWLGPLRTAVQGGQIAAKLYQGRWTDVGTPERLAQLQKEIDEI
jgi:MurNAc alpha-1-phosphate uridylyltransferase